MVAIYKAWLLGPVNAAFYRGGFVVVLSSEGVVFLKFGYI